MTGKTIEKISEEDLKFLDELEEKLHTLKDVVLPYDQGRGKIDEYKKNVISSEEMNNLKKIIEDGEYVFFPKQGPFGFYPCFELSSFEQIYPGAPIEKIHHLSFSIGQLPEGENFKTMSEYFMDKRNLEMAKVAKVKFKNNEDHYIY